MIELARGADYEFSLLADGPAPCMRLMLRGRPLVDLRVASGCDADGQYDVVGSLEGPEIAQSALGTRITWRGSSSLWSQSEFSLTCATEHVRFGYRVVGRGAVDRARYFCTAPDGWSTAHFSSLFNPEPTSSNTQRFPPGKLARVGVGSDKRYHGGNWFFSPGPLCFVLERDSACLAVGVAEGAGRLGFTDFEALASSPGRFGLALTYDGHLRVDGEWSVPELVLLPASDPYAAIQRYCDWLRSVGLAPAAAPRNPPDWWREPIFCGWGEQVNHAAGPSSTTRAADLATQANYQNWLGILESHAIEPGTVVLDDKWQATYGDNEFDTRKWPYARGFIDAQHARARKVLLWLQAWGVEGLPVEECVLDADGQPVAADPTQLAYASRLRRGIRRMLVDYDADGFKLDFTHRIPVGPSVRTASGLWGVDLMLHLLSLIRDAMREAKPDALLIAHTANPAFADLVDMLRLNDVPGIAGDPKSYVEPMRHRARVARAAGPWWLIDTDNWPSPDRRSFLEYLAAQPAIGVPSLYFASGIAWQSPGEAWRSEPFVEGDYAAIRRVWAAYRQQVGLPARG